MKGKTTITSVLILSYLSSISCQVNGVRAPLIQCYNVSAIPGITEANNRPPTNLNLILEMIRRMEDANPNLSTREFSLALLQRLRQDGIMKTGQTVDLAVSIPFSTYRLEAYKFTVLLQGFLANTSNTLYFGDLDQREVCAFHYAISSTIDNAIRGDESSTCTRSARYTARLRRVATEDEPTTLPLDQPIDGADVETVVEGIEGFGTKNVGSTPEIIQCPLELGVVYTNYGTIKIGQVIAGISTGLNRQTFQNADNRYAATIAGEIAEAALAQGRTIIQIGAPGGWNGTVNPRYYFLQKSTHLQLTDAEIRGSLDGLYMSLSADQWKNRDLKISQMIDMYYSPTQRGVLDPGFRACNRNILYSEMVTTERLLTEVLNFMTPLDQGSTYNFTISESAYPSLADAAVNSFNTYLTQMNTNDLACVPQESLERVATDLIVFIDPSWNFNTIQPVLSYILDNVDVNKFGSRYTIFAGADGTNITSNSTRYLLDFHKQYNLTVHQSLRSGFDYNRIYEIMEGVVKSKLDNRTYTGGESTVVLLLPRTVPNDNQKSFLEQRKEIMRNVLPDVNVIVLGAGTQADYTSVVLTPSRDFILLTDTTNENDIRRNGQSVIDRIKNVPRAVVNPGCTSSFSGSASSFSAVQYVEPTGINYYRIAPNYFHSGGEGRQLKVTENSYGSIQVCFSREQSKPNNASSDCQTLRSGALRTIDINGFCAGSLSDCAPIYLSVAGLTSDIKCKDPFCRFPDEIRYTIAMENVGCYSSSFRIAASLTVVTALLLFLQI